MNRTDPRAWASLAAQLHDAARTARRVADERDASPARTATAGVVHARPADQEARHMPRPRAVPAPARTPVPAGLPAQLFRSLYRAWDLHRIDIAVPKGTAWFAARSLADLARQISDHTSPDTIPACSDVAAGGPTGGIR
jgi:hypothetical protein